jgi:hypothetical protein
MNEPGRTGPDLSQVLLGLRQCREQDRRRVANDPVTIALLEAAINLVRRNLGPGAERKLLRPDDPDSVERPLFKFLAQQSIADEATRSSGFHATTNTLRERWLHHRDFYADLCRYSQCLAHYPGGLQHEIADATQEIIDGCDPVAAIHRLSYWDLRRRRDTPMFRLGLLAAAQADGDPPVQAAIAARHQENESAWATYCQEFLQSRHLKLRPGITLQTCVTLLTALADGLTVRAITETGPASSQIIDDDRGRCLLSTGALALIASCTEPEGQGGDGLSLEESVTALIDAGMAQRGVLS